MPEGPSLIILKEELRSFIGKKIISVSGNSKQEIQRLEGQKILDLKTWGKHFIIQFKKFSVRIHFLLFGKYTINEKRDAVPRMALQFAKGEFNVYNCSLKFIEEPLDEVYDWSADIMGDAWDNKSAKKKLMAKPDTLVTDALLDQTVFAGVGNIIKNEVLYRIKVHPLSTIRALPTKKLNELIKEARIYSFQFLEWKRAYILRKQWKAHTKKTCVRCDGPIIKEYLGKTARRTFFCTTCQVMYG